MSLPKSPTIEKYFPVREVSEKSRREKAKGVPISNMLFWWTRKPLTACRAVIAGVATDMDPEKFKRAIALDRDRPYEVNTSIRVEGIKLLDPFAGGGSIPFEALRMGIDVTAVELLPVAYVLLQATLEYPLKYGKKLVKDVEKWGKELTKRLKEKVGHLYRKGDLTYIGTWSVKCPKCGFWTPLVKNWWLDKKRNIWMKPIIEGEKLRIEIARGEGKPPSGTISRGTGTCIRCGNTIKEDYVKDALKRYLNGDKSLAKPRLLAALIKTPSSRDFRPATDEDIKLLLEAEKQVKKLIEKGDHDIPTESIPPYETRSIWVVSYGFEKWYQLFNPRQLLTIVTLVKLIGEIESEIEKEKIKEGWSPDNVKEYVKAVITYLTFASVEYARHNSYTSHWNPSGVKLEHGLAFRGAAMAWNFCEVNPFTKVRGSLVNMFKKILSALKFAVKNFYTSTNNNQLYQEKSEIKKPNVKVLLASATNLPMDEKFDLIVTDPPYYDDVPYAELSDYYYVWLKRIIGKYYPEAFHYNTQWEELALQEVSVNPARFNVPNAKQRSIEHFRALLKRSVKECYRLLKDDGLLVVFFAHSSVEAWRDLVEALQSAGFEITRTWPVHTEKTGRATALGKAVIDTSLIVVARKRMQGEGVGYIEELKPKVRATVRDEVKRLVQEFNLKGADLINAAMGPALKIITQHNRIERASIGGTVADVLKIVEETVVPAFLEVKLGSQMMARLDPHTSFYVYTRISYGVHGKEKKLILPFDHANRIALALGVDINELVKARMVKYIKGKGRKDIEVVLPRGNIKNFLKERDLDLDEPVPRNIIDVVHLLEAAYNMKGHKGVDELYGKLKGFRGFDVEAIKTVIQALYTGLDEDDPEKPLLKPLVNLDFREVGLVTLDKFFR